MTRRALHAIGVVALGAGAVLFWTSVVGMMGAAIVLHAAREGGRDGKG